MSALDRPRFNAARALLAVLGCALLTTATAQTVRTVSDTALRNARTSDAATLTLLNANAPVDLLQLSGGWAQVQTPGPGGVRGWLRASQLDLRPPEVAPASQIETGRRAGRNTAVTLGSRSLPPRSNRHAVIVGVGNYRVDPARPVEALAGLGPDMSSALQIARALQVPDANITLLRDEAATADAIAAAFGELAAQTQPGDRVFVYWSGRGSRQVDPVEGGCVDSLLSWDLKDVTNHELARWLQPIGERADKIVVVTDASHVGGGATERWQPKYARGSLACQTAESVRSRRQDSSARTLGLAEQDMVRVSSSRDDEVSLQNPLEGGLATRALRQCLLDEAADTDGGGSVSAQELADCTQARMNASLAGTAQFGAPQLGLAGNRDIVPAWFANSRAQPGDAGANPEPGPVLAPPAPIGRVLEQIHEQRDSKRQVRVSVDRKLLNIGTDTLRFSVTSSHAGLVYVAMLGSDRQTLYLLFPNRLDLANRIGAGETLALPRANWQIVAAGPAGTDRLLVLVADGPRDLSSLRALPAGPFVQPLTDAQGRAQLQWLLGTNAAQAAMGACAGPACSDAFGSALVDIEER